MAKEPEWGSADPDVVSCTLALRVGAVVVGEAAAGADVAESLVGARVGFFGSRLLVCVGAAVAEARIGANVGMWLGAKVGSVVGDFVGTVVGAWTR